MCILETKSILFLFPVLREDEIIDLHNYSVADAMDIAKIALARHHGRSNLIFITGKDYTVKGEFQGSNLP